MKKLQTIKMNKRFKRAKRVRKQMHGTAKKPRLSVFKSNQHVGAQLIDDDTQETLTAVSTKSKAFKGSEFGKKSKKSAAKIGEQIAAFAKKHNIETVIFDRGASKYHGILAELANAAREGGLKF